jgi:hypothetical protein
MLSPIHAACYLKLLARPPVLECQVIDLEVISIVRRFPAIGLIADEATGCINRMFFYKRVNSPSLRHCSYRRPIDKASEG